MRLGVLDIGSNTVHLLVLDAHHGARPAPLASHKNDLQLVTYLDGEGNISDQGKAALVDFILDALRFAVKHQVEDLVAFATSAIREAPNGEEVLAHVKRETNLTLQELPGAGEASMTFLAVRRWYGWGAGRILNLDIGGGSFEMAIGLDEEPAVALSVPLGANRVTRDFLQGDPPSPEQVKKLRKHIRKALKDPVRDILKEGRPDVVAGTSKTFRSLARIAGAASAEAGEYAKRELHLRDLNLWASRLSAMSFTDREDLPGVSAMRAPQLLGGALVAEAALEMLDLPSMEICPWALREGVLLDRFDRLSSPSLSPRA